MRKLLLVLVVLMVVALAAGYLLPESTTISRDVDVAAPPSAVFPMVADLRRVRGWQAAAARDPAMMYDVAGAPMAVGQHLSWNSDQWSVGRGAAEITAVEADRAVNVAVHLRWVGALDSRMEVAPAGDGARVSWRLHAEHGLNPMRRWIGFALDQFAGPEMEKSLKALKAEAEAGAAAGTNE